MVDRYALDINSDLLSKQFNLSVAESFDPMYNCAPSQMLPVTTVDQPEMIQNFQWGLISAFANNKKLSPKLFNIDFKQVVTKPATMRQLTSHRCVIYATGFFLWKPISKKSLSPYYFQYGNGKAFRIGGIWENYESMEGETFNTFQMITTDSSVDLVSYQDTIPLILNKDNGDRWLHSEETPDTLAAFYTDSVDQDFVIHPVSPAIRDLRNNDRKLLEPVNPTDQHGNYTLFG